MTWHVAVPSYELAIAAVSFVVAFAVLYAVQRIDGRQLRRFIAAARMPFLGYVEQVAGATRLPFLLALSPIRNFKRIGERRASFEFGVSGEAQRADVEAIAALVKGIVEAAEPVRLDRVHFKSFGDSALLFEVVYYVLDADYNRYMDIQQQINLALLRQFRARDIAFAYPTSTRHIAALAPAMTAPAQEAPVLREAGGAGRGANR